MEVGSWGEDMKARGLRGRCSSWVRGVGEAPVWWRQCPCWGAGMACGMMVGGAVPAGACSGRESSRVEGWGMGWWPRAKAGPGGQ